MTIVSATAQVGGSDALRPRVYVGNTVHAIGVFTDLARHPAAVADVTFLWRDPGGVEVTTLGYPEAGSPPASWTSKLEVTVPGLWAVRPQCETPSRQLDWIAFAVVPGFGDPDIAPSPLWLTGDDTGLLTYGGGVLTARRIAELPAADEFLPGDVLPVSREGGETEGVSGALILAAATGAAAASVLPFGTGATPYAATIAPGSITETVNGVQVVTTIAAGVITEAYGSPINQTWRTTVAAGVVSKVLV